MGLVGRIVKSIIKNNLREIQQEQYENSFKNPRQVLPPGIDSVPIENDQGVMIILGSMGKGAHLGVYPDPQAAVGEIRIYSRDKNGNLKGQLWIKNDGVIEINGNSDFAVAYTDLNAGIQQMGTDINAELAKIATAINAIVPGSYTPSLIVPNIAASKVSEVKLP
jgi:hypothetical protein